MTSTLTHVYHLAGEIGPRGTGSAGGSIAVDYVVDHLSRLGILVERQQFQKVSPQALDRTTDFVVAVLNELDQEEKICRSS